jgi:iron complex transport system permease protein
MAGADARAARQGRGYAVARLGGLSFRFWKRGLVVYAFLLAGIFAASLASLMIGDYDIGLGEAFAYLTRAGDGLADAGGDRLASYFVTDVRLPRVVAGVLVGAALGASGAVFQTLSGNPLGSPDIIGFTKGSATGALVVIVVFSGGSAAAAAGAVVGGLLTAGLVYGLSWNRGAPGYRLVLVGIGVGASLAAVNALLVVKAPLATAQTAVHWMAGSLNASLWREVALTGVTLAVLTGVVVSRSRALNLFPYGDALAAGLGARTERDRFILLFTGVMLAAMATALSGPVSFVALVAPHLVKKITRGVGAPLFGAALMGAFLVVGGDLAARRIVAPDELAVGIVTGSLGGLYLIALLVSEWRKMGGRAGV